MHELSVTQHMLEIVVRHAEQAQAARITDIHLVIGQLSSFIDESIQFYWDTLSSGTLAEGAQLHFERVPAQVECTECGQRSTLTESAQGCLACGSLNVRVVAGEEFYVRAIQVQAADEIEQEATA